MIIINRNQSNTVILTLSEKVTLENPFYLFHVKDQFSNYELTFIVSDVSSAQTRYNKFIIQENISQDLLNGIICLSAHSSINHYKVYQQQSAVNLDVNQSGKLLEEGLLYYSANTSINIISNNGGINFITPNT